MAVDPNKNYKRMSTDHVHTGQQILNLLEIATPDIQAIVLLSIYETDEPASNPNDKYGLPAGYGATEEDSE